MCFPFLAAQGHSRRRVAVLAEDDGAGPAGAGQPASARAELELPVDLVVADRLAAEAEVKTIDGVDVPDG